MRLVGADADFRVSPRVVRPVTFGLRAPVVLVPPGFARSSPRSRRRWPPTNCCTSPAATGCAPSRTRSLLSVLWFHPALWWLVDQIRLSTEQLVDGEVVRLVGARKPYLEALLKLAAAGPTPMLQPASPFLKHGHLAQRVALLVREVSMSRVRLVCSFAVVLAVLAAGGWFVVQAFPLSATPEAGGAALGAGRLAASCRAAAPSAASSAATAREAGFAGQRGQGPEGEGHDAGRVREGGRGFDGQAPRLIRTTPKCLTRWRRSYWNQAYNGSGLSSAKKPKLVETGLKHADEALQLKPKYMEALVYKNLLLRSKAELEPTRPRSRR